VNVPPANIKAQGTGRIINLINLNTWKPPPFIDRVIGPDGCFPKSR
jgi:hypothetical protein